MSPIRNGGEPLTLVAIVDVTESIELHERRSRCSRSRPWASWRGVAHDFNNLLTAILGHASILRQHLHEDDDAQEHVAAIRSAGRSAAT